MSSMGTVIHLRLLNTPICHETVDLDSNQSSKLVHIDRLLSGFILDCNLANLATHGFASRRTMLRGFLGSFIVVHLVVALPLGSSLWCGWRCRVVGEILRKPIHVVLKTNSVLDKLFQRRFLSFLGHAISTKGNR